MNNLMKLTSSIFLIVFLSACQNNLTTPSKPKIDNSLESINASSIKYLKDTTSIGFEWQKVDDTRVVGYNLYRANALESNGKLKRIKFIENRYTTHYLDKHLEAHTSYVYAFSSVKEDDFESRISNSINVTTEPLHNSVSFIQAISNLPRQIKIIWRPHTQNKIAYYKIQRSSPTESEWEDLDTIEGRLQAEFIDSDLDDNVVYKYRLFSYTYEDLQSKPSAIVTAQTKPLPKGILNLSASSNMAKKIVLNWDASVQEDIIFYKIYQNSSLQGSFKHIKTLSRNDLSYEITEHEDGKNIFFKVTTLDKDKLESSININAVMGTTLGKPTKPVMTLAQIKENKAILNWQKGDNRAVSYIVYKTAKTGYFSIKKLKYSNINALRFEDEDIVRGVEYKYSIQAVDEFGILSLQTDESLLVLPKLQK